MTVKLIRLDMIKLVPELSVKTAHIVDMSLSLECFGQLTPIAVSESFILLDGYKRFQAAKFLGWRCLEGRFLPDEALGYVNILTYLYPESK